MNNATLALNVARPSAPTKPPVVGHAQDDTQPSRRFDAALDAAHADARAPHKQPEAVTKAKDAAPSPAKADDAKVTARQDDKPAKKDDEAGDGTSIATTMLSLIGVPPSVADVAAKALGAVKDASAADVPGAGSALGAAASLAGLLPGAAAAEADAAAGLQDATAASLNTTSSALPAGTLAGAAVTPASFAVLLATQDDAKGAKDDGSTVDAANGSPMPFAHAQGIGQGSTSVMQLQATQPATSPQFAHELGEQIAWMGSGQVKEARIKLHPEELGSMDVRVSLDGSKVNVAVMAQHPAAVHAVQQTLSQLDSMLAHHGLSLGQADVGQRQAEQGADGGNGNASGQSGDAGTAGVETVVTSRVSRGLVDEVA
ncbi:flagellar hook-length control protein FliK [Luteibacter sp.]|jgi:flagellar hook-length control protein FliK|uniref:flagellar hook-length control protein FliK n=1 Tax=Luteibacter sp. TaxID=1886636 RepID=UPI002F41FB74